MSSRSDKRLFRTLRFRLTLFHAGLFFGLPALAFLLIYLNLESILYQTLDEELRTEIHEWEVLYRDLGLEGLQIEFRDEVQILGNNQVFCRFFAPDRTQLASSDLGAWGELPPPREEFFLSEVPGPEAAELETVALPGKPHECRVIWSRLEGGHLFQFGISLEKNTRMMAGYRKVFMVAALLMLVAGGGAGYIMARRAVKGLDKITDGIRHVTGGDFSRRVSLSGEGEEIEILAQAVNHMQDRVQSLIRELKEVGNNIAHDLRSPITRIRGAAETTLTKEHTLKDCRETLGIVIEESDRLVAMIETMLVIAEADSGIVDYTAEQVELSAVVQGAVDLFHAVAEESGVSLKADLPEGPIRMQGDKPKLQRVVANLLDNAIKYTPQGGEVAVKLTCSNGEIVLEVADTGIGIPARDLPRIFDRFFRGDSSRSSPGNGLGLSYVKSIVQAHGGEVSAQSAPGERTVFRLRFN